MASMISSSWHCIAFFILFAQLAYSVITPKPTIIKPSSTYIIQTNHLSRPSHFATQAQWYTSILGSLLPTNASRSRIFYTYGTIMHGFAAVLTPDEARRMSDTPGVIGIYEDRVLQLHTTRSPGFLGLDTDFGLRQEADFGDGVIIGLVDTGIWPESLSFNDSGLGSVRPKWRGKCVDGERFNASMCNNKLVGAKFFTTGMEAQQWATYKSYGFQSPRDSVGHGTHTSSTAAGSEVPNSNLFGFARGTARGMAPKAKIAMYKACLDFVCLQSDLLAAIDAAVDDGVDIISMSIGGSPTDYYNDIIAIGMFAAVRKGIFVACAAGNDGPMASSVTNVAPWIMTVGAGTVDRTFPVRIILGSGEVLIGESLYNMPANQTDMIPLVLSDCTPGNDLVPDKIMGKIALCTGVDVSAGISVQMAGGAGLVALNPQWAGEDIIVQAFTLPALSLGYTASQKLITYVNSVPYPVASFHFACQTVIGENRAPMVTSYSSRGPSQVVGEILKPDIIAPGLNILAAWPVESPLSFSDLDPRRSSFNIISGTSMSCPHVAGIAALLKHAHPKWSPAMIRSALMTTAVTLDNDFRPIIDDDNMTNTTPLAVGAGLVHPQLARDPGLVYETGAQDYIDLLCTLNYTKEQLRKFVAGPVNCTRKLQGGPSDLNYPSFVVVFDNNTNIRILTRTLTKVSDLPEMYNVSIVTSDRVTVTVTPASLVFKEQYEKRSYVVEFRSKVLAGNVTVSSEFGYIIWENEMHQVKSPVVFMWN